MHIHCQNWEDKGTSTVGLLGKEGTCGNFTCWNSYEGISWDTFNTLYGFPFERLMGLKTVKKEVLSKLISLLKHKINMNSLINT